MHITPTNNTSFKTINYSKVRKQDLGYVRDELSKLKEIAKNYDITLKSEKCLNYPSIAVTVSPLAENLSLFRKIFKPKATMHFFMEQAPYPEADNEYLVDIAKKAIDYLEAK